MGPRAGLDKCGISRPHRYSIPLQSSPLLVAIPTELTGPILVSQGLVIEASRWHSDTPHSLGLLWTSDQPDAETPTCQHTTLTTVKPHKVSGGIRTHNPSNRAAIDPHLRPLGHFQCNIIFHKTPTTIVLNDYDGLASAVFHSVIRTFAWIG